LLNKCLAPRGLAIISMIGAALLAFGERDFASLPFVFAVFCAIWMGLLVLSKRLRFSLVTCWLLIIFITVISTMKLHYMGLGLHVFDFYFYQRNSEIYRFLIDAYLPVVLLSAAIFAVGVIISVLIYRRDVVIKTPRVVLAGLFAAAIVAAAVSNPRADDDQSYHLIAHRTSSFFVSLADIRFLMSNPAFAERMAAYTRQSGYQGLHECSQAKERPDIIAVLMESAVPPSIYPSIKAGAALNDKFRSADGVIRPLRVETFGGGTWITTAALMTSLPAVEFGWLRPYLPVYLQGRVHHSLPKLLRQCGYKTAVISPLPYPFVNEGPFMTSLGFEDYRDAQKIGARSRHERDSFYFQAALDYIRQHRTQDGRPLFLFIMTMAAHGPYSYPFEPDFKTLGEPFGNDEETDEYLRRLTMQQMDFEAFNRDLATLNINRGTIVLDFGDHQPSVTLALAEAVEGPKALAHWDSIAYHTYYRIRALHTSLATALPKYESMDIAYLAPTLLQEAGLPIDDVYTELLSLREECKGAFFLCSDRARIERHLKRLAKGHLLDIGPGVSPKAASAETEGPKSAQRILNAERVRRAAAFGN
jgi:phosphoglycerol transferase MdoB-like AlkP superfamily enzyme